MKIFVAGATGALGKRLVPKLVQAGYTVVGTTRHAAKRGSLETMGAKPLLLDALDRNAVISAVQSERPEVIVHELTAIPARFNIRHFDREFAPTNRLRTESTDNLISAARAGNVRRFVAQSYAGWPYAREGSAVKSEEDRLDPNPPAAFRRTFDAIRHLEAAVLGAADLEGIVLRYGSFYGPGTSIGE